MTEEVDYGRKLEMTVTYDNGFDHKFEVCGFATFPTPEDSEDEGRSFRVPLVNVKSITIAHPDEEPAA